MAKKQRQVKPWEKANARGIALQMRQYGEWMRGKNYTGKSIESAQQRVGFFLRWCCRHGIENVQAVSEETLYRYQKHVMGLQKEKTQQALSIVTRHNYLVAVWAFFKWLVKNEHILYDPTQNLRLPRVVDRLPKTILNRQEVERIINTPDIKKPLGIRDRAMLEMLYSCGLRASEMVHLTIHDVNLAQGIILVQEGKGRQDRVIPVGERACQWLSKYLEEVRPCLVRGVARAETRALFLTVLGKAWQMETLSACISQYVKAAGITKPGACHLFRHAMATHMLENGADIRYIQEMLGHTDLSTTHIYTRVSIQKLKEIHQATHPANQSDGSVPPLPRQPRLPANRAKGSVGQGSKPMVQTVGQDDTKSLAGLTNQYLRWLEVNGFSSDTVANRCTHLRVFLKWCEQRTILTPQAVSKNTLIRYQSYLYRLRTQHSQKPLSVRYYTLLLCSLRKFFSWLAQIGQILCNPAAGIELPRKPHYLPRQIMTPAEVEIVLNLPDLSSPVGLRDRAILETLYSTGIRRGELRELTVDDIDSTNATLRVNRGKGGKSRVIPLGQRALGWIEKYVEWVRSRQEIEENVRTLFLSSLCSPFSRKQISYIMRKYVRAAKIGKSGACHIFRHSMATHMLENGADVRYIQEMLGHASLSTTQIYTKVSIAKLKEVHSKTHPANIKRQTDQAPEVLQ